jgi:predicted Zn-dependent protease
MAPDPHDPEKEAPPGRGLARYLRGLFARDSRDYLWAFLDFLDARPVFKKGLLIGTPVLLLAVGFGAWSYEHWARANAVRIARQWLDAGRLDRAAVAVQEALVAEPGQPAPWRLASELAWKKCNRPISVEYAKRAAVVSRYDTDEVIAWSEASILTDDVTQAEEALTHLDSGTLRAAPRALRVAGEIARRKALYGEARDRFQAALVADLNAGATSSAIDEIPLGIVCLQTGSEADHSRGLSLLTRWAANPQWGVDALRALLADAFSRGDREAMARWAEALRRHPRCSLGDVPTCLKALAASDPVRYQAMLDEREEKGRASPNQAAQLLGWLAEIGQGAEAVRWARTLDPEGIRRPPVAPGIAEALRSTNRWAELDAWVDQAQWGTDLGFMGSAYGLAAARHLGDGPKADEQWRSLYSAAQANAAHAVFAGDLLYAWGYPEDAAKLLWLAADQQGLAYQALGSLARLYQVQKDAVGQYKAFSRLDAMRPADRNIANNYAYFAALTDLGSPLRIERIAEDNFRNEPSNLVYRSTYAFVLVWSGQAPKALKLMEPVSRNWKRSPAVAFAYGAALAKSGRQAEAREVFNALNPSEMDHEAVTWVRDALR